MNRHTKEGMGQYQGQEDLERKIKKLVRQHSAKKASGPEGKERPMKEEKVEWTQEGQKK